MFKKGKKFWFNHSRTGQNMIEYLLVFAGVAVLLIAALGPGGVYNKRVDDSVNLAVQGTQCMALQTCFDPEGCASVCGNGCCEPGEIASGCTDCGCRTDSDCDDGVYCNGINQRCAGGTCTAPTPINVSDGISCTVDSCNEETNSVDHDPRDQDCAPDPCSGGVSCSPTGPPPSGCIYLPGPPDDQDDGFSCTRDGCDAGGVFHIPDNSLCRGKSACNQDGICDPGNPFADSDGCVADTGVMDDGVYCTIDVCVGGNIIQHNTDDARCDNGLFCDGEETCTPTGCVSTPNPIDDFTLPADDPCLLQKQSCDPNAIAANNCCVTCFCDEEIDQIVTEINDFTCDDQLECTQNETCQPGVRLLSDPPRDARGCVSENTIDPNDNVNCTEDVCVEGSQVQGMHVENQPQHNQCFCSDLNDPNCLNYGNAFYCVNACGTQTGSFSPIGDGSVVNQPGTNCLDPGDDPSPGSPVDGCFTSCSRLTANDPNGNGEGAPVPGVDNTYALAGCQPQYGETCNNCISDCSTCGDGCCDGTASPNGRNERCTGQTKTFNTSTGDYTYTYTNPDYCAGDCNTCGDGCCAGNETCDASPTGDPCLADCGRCACQMPDGWHEDGYAAWYWKTNISCGFPDNQFCNANRAWRTCSNGTIIGGDSSYTDTSCNPLPRDGVWSIWFDVVNGCNIPLCGMDQIRYCDSNYTGGVTPGCGGAPCSGSSTQTDTSSNCGFSNGVWSAYQCSGCDYCGTSCSATCGGSCGTQCVGQANTTCGDSNGQWTWPGTCVSCTETATCTGQSCDGAGCSGSAPTRGCGVASGGWTANWVSYGGCVAHKQKKRRYCNSPCPTCGGSCTRNVSGATQYLTSPLICPGMSGPNIAQKLEAC